MEQVETDRGENGWANDSFARSQHLADKCWRHIWLACVAEKQISAHQDVVRGSPGKDCFGGMTRSGSHLDPSNRYPKALWDFQESCRYLPRTG